MPFHAKALRIHLPGLCVAALIAACGTRAPAANPVLNWQNKSDTAAPSYPVPPSPYGQVGDPFLHTLRWPAKAPVQDPVAPPPAHAASVAAPVPVSRPAPVAVASLPPPPSVQATPSLSAYPDPGLADDPDMAPETPATAQPARTGARPAVNAPVHTASSTAPLEATAPDTGYQVPASSPYAARIAAARAAAARQAALQPTTTSPLADAGPQKPDIAPQTKPASGKTPPVPNATAPSPGTSLASQETDHVFVPGEHYTDASDAPRFYSLHREYGYHPDPITVDDNATGALLSVTPDKDDGDTASDSDSSATSNGQKANP